MIFKLTMENHKSTNFTLMALLVIGSLMFALIPVKANGDEPNVYVAAPDIIFNRIDKDKDGKITKDEVNSLNPALFTNAYIRMIVFRISKAAYQ